MAIASAILGRRGGEAVRGCAGCDAVQRHGDPGGLYPRAAREVGQRRGHQAVLPEAAGAGTCHVSSVSWRVSFVLSGWVWLLCFACVLKI